MELLGRKILETGDDFSEGYKILNLANGLGGVAHDAPFPLASAGVIAGSTGSHPWEAIPWPPAAPLPLCWHPPPAASCGPKANQVHILYG